MEDLEIIETFNTGFYGVVKKVRDKKSSVLKCLKIIDKKEFNEEIIKLKKINFEFLKKNNIVNIIKIYDYWEDEKKLYSLNEYTEGIELQKFILKNKINLDDIILILNQITKTMKNYFDLGRYYFDLRLEKIIIDDNKKIKIIDNGCNIEINEFENNKLNIIDEIYQPPEYKNSKNIEKIIVWNLGIVLHFLLTLRFPFDGPKDKRLKEKFIFKNKNNKYPIEIKEILENMLEIDVNKRLEFSKLIF